MKKQIYILLFELLFLIVATQPISAQIINTEGQYVDTTFNDNIDRTAEDFVIASLVIADPGTVLYSVLGHACIRMQCPTFDMDYCFSYESDTVNQKVLSFLAGKLTMGLFAIPTTDYCTQYCEQGRGVYEYTLNLPIDVKRELWRVLDKHLAEGIYLPYDYLHQGCAITAKNFVKEALGETKIQYDSSLYNTSRSAKDICKKQMENALWARFFCYSIASGMDAEKPLWGEKQLIVPIGLVNAWQQATVNGKPLLTKEPNILVEGKPQVANGWFTPMILALTLLILSIINFFWKKPYFDWLMLAIQTIIGCGLIYLMCFSDLCCTDWNWLIIVFNPLPIIFWHWKKYWALPYTIILILWSINMTIITIWSHTLITWSHIVLSMTFSLIILKQSNILQTYKKKLKRYENKQN